MEKKVKIEPMTGLQQLIQAKKAKEKTEEMQEAKMESTAMKSVLRNKKK